MPGKLGRKLLLKLGDGVEGSETFTTVGSLTSKSLSLNGTDIENTADDSVDANDVLWVETLEGVHSATVTGDGRVKDNVQEKALFALKFTNDTKRNWQIVVPGIGTIQGPFRLTQLDSGGETSGDGTYAMSLTSAGALAFTPEA